MKTYARRMTFEDRKLIEKMYRDGEPVRAIAAVLNRDLSGVYRELDRGATGKLDKNGNAGYSARIGEATAEARRMAKGRTRIVTAAILSNQNTFDS